MDNTATRDTFVMTFTTSLGGQKIVRLTDPRPNLNLAFAKAMGEALSQVNLFEPAIGRLNQLVGAAVVTETITTLI